MWQAMQWVVNTVAPATELADCTGATQTNSLDQLMRRLKQIESLA